VRHVRTRNIATPFRRPENVRVEYYFGVTRSGGRIAKTQWNQRRKIGGDNPVAVAINPMLTVRS
jgi:hypothetical protein